MFVESDAPAEAADQTLVHFIAMQMEKRPRFSKRKNLHIFLKKRTNDKPRFGGKKQTNQKHFRIGVG